MLQIIFISVTILSFGILFWSFSKVFKIINILKKPYSISNTAERIKMTLKVVFGQNKILRFPIIGLMHALLFWGFLFILFGSGEMLVDGILGLPFDSDTSNDRIFGFLGYIYDFIMAAGDIAGFMILIFVIVFFIRRNFMKIKRFSGNELRHKDHKDASIALLIIMILMITLLGMNAGYIANSGSEGIFPISSFLAKFIPAESAHSFELINWWFHIIFIFFFANYLPYSKHFHVFMSAPNVYFSRTEPLTKMNKLESVTTEVKLMLDPNAEPPPMDDDIEIERFGMKDVEDGTWKNYIDALACTQCGRCTSVCPANKTGKKLSPRKIVLDYRRRMEEKADMIIKEGKSYDDGKSLYSDYTTYEEIWACTTCNACAQECPINIDQPSMILEMRRYIFMEESAAPSLINAMSTNIENNGAPWKYSTADRLKWADKLYLNDDKKTEINVPLAADKFAKGRVAEYLFWVGSTGCYDEGGIRISQNFVKILEHCGIDYAVLGTEESDSGDNAKRAGNEFLFQMQAMMNIEIMNKYGVKKIVTCDPHDFNTLKNEYCELNGNYEVIHHTQLISELIKKGKLEIDINIFAQKNITFHDPCYLGRGNGEYEAPRFVLKRLSNNFKDMKHCKSSSLCCGAGGTQMFKESEKGDSEIYEMKTEEALETKPDIIATACPMCMTMITDGIKMKDKENDIQVMDIAEIIVKSLKI